MAQLRPTSEVIKHELLLQGRVTAPSAARGGPRSSIWNEGARGLEDARLPPNTREHLCSVTAGQPARAGTSLYLTHFTVCLTSEARENDTEKLRVIFKIMFTDCYHVSSSFLLTESAILANILSIMLFCLIAYSRLNYRKQLFAHVKPNGSQPGGLKEYLKYENKIKY